MGLSIAADIATLLIVAQTILILLIPLALLAVMVKGMIELNRKLKVVMPQIQGYARQLSSTTDRVSQRIAEPVIKREARVARRQAMRRHMAESARAKLGRTSSIPDEAGGNQI